MTHVKISMYVNTQKYMLRSHSNLGKGEYLLRFLYINLFLMKMEYSKHEMMSMIVLNYKERVDLH